MSDGAPAAVGIDVGGTKVLGVVVDLDGNVLLEQRQPTPRMPEGIVDALVDTAAALAAETDCGQDVPIGIGLPGIITNEGVLRASPNLPGVFDLDVAGRVGQRVEPAVVVTNDATAAAMAEWRAGAARGIDDMVMITLGTGIGGGVVSAGQVMTGANGFTGEFGHMVVDVHGLPCPCGRSGCWERYASGSGLATHARLAAIGGRLRRVVQLAGGAEEVRGEHVQAAAREGDEEALAVIDTFGRWVALGLANLTNAFDPAMFVLGGGLAEGAELYLGPIDRWYGELLYAPDHRPRPVIAFAELGERAGAIGAALHAVWRTDSSSFGR